ncbi:MAG: zinc-dependent metalloprotease [Spirosoma sp.]|nr:zinc-dependent metalloprotease [Spirosoma sp.]
MNHTLRILFLFILSAATLRAQPATNAPADIAKFTAGMAKNPGFLTFYDDAKKGKIWLEISKFDTELLYYPTLAQGVGSNDIGLDRGRLGQEHVVKFQRSGNKVLMIEPNYAYRAITSDAPERRAVEESFAQSVHAGFEIAAEDANGTVLVDLTPFLMQDAVGAAKAIAQTKQGTYKFDAMRSALYMNRSKAFPQNTEFETIITLTGENPGAYLREVVPTPEAVTMHQHHSFVQLPPLTGPDAYQPRLFDPRIGYGGIEFFDYATPVNQPITKRYISRHRLVKKDPSAAMSEAVKPIIYYMDPGAPEPIRQALMDGTAWWNQAFEAAGFRDAFQVKLLPPDADPMDIRYNLVQWVHRSTRGWSYGASIIDPRTGEILKGKVTLGSLRVRQDYLIAQGLVGNFDGPTMDSSKEDPMMQMSIARLRQLAAHEVGHTLGLPHNYISSTQERASVMDYPTMVAKLNGNTIDLSDAYAKNIGEYDKWSIRYGYEQFTPGTDEKIALQKIVQDMQKTGLLFLTDQDARPEGSVHPATHLWDNGRNAVEELNRVLDVRQVVLRNFSERKIPVGMPMATLEEVFVPMYMFHRYQVEAAVKVVGGMTYTNALRGNQNAGPEQRVMSVVPANEQNQALDALFGTLNPRLLAVPTAVLNLIPPRPFRFDPNQREVFKRHTGMAFDAMGPPEAAASLTLRLLLNPERCARLAHQTGLYYQNLPSLDGVLASLVRYTFGTSKDYRSQPLGASYLTDIQRMTQQKVLEHLMQLAVNTSNEGAVRASAHRAIMSIKQDYASKQVRQTSTRSDALGAPIRDEYPDYLYWLINQYEANPGNVPMTMPLPAPDGSPIDPGQEWLTPDCDWTR